MFEDLFYRFVKRHPETARRESFALLTEGNPLPWFKLQPWPVFLDNDQLGVLEARNAAVARLVRSVPGRIFAGDPRRLYEYYRLHSAEWLTLALAQPDGSGSAIFRGDFLESERGLVCIEMNGGNAGGWLLSSLAPLYERVPILARFFASQHLTLSAGGGARVLFREWVHAARQLEPFASATTLDLAVTVDPKEPGEFNAAGLALCRRAYREALCDIGPSLVGELSFCNWSELRALRSKVRRGGRRLAIVVEEALGEGEIANRVFRAFKAQQLTLVTGPAAHVWNDKRNFALLSEHGDSPLFSDEERRTIATCIPWTRRVADAAVRFGGIPARLPDLLDKQRDSFVLKRAGSDGGREVFLGRFSARSTWDRLIRYALEEGDWVAQEWIEPRARMLLSCDAGPALHHVVLGPFLVGERAGGGLVRVLRADGYAADSGGDSLLDHAVRKSRNSDLTAEVAPLMTANPRRARTVGHEGWEKEK